MKSSHWVIGGIAALALLGSGVGSTVSHVAKGADQVAGMVGGHDNADSSGGGGFHLPTQERLALDAGGAYALGKGGSACLGKGIKGCTGLGQKKAADPQAATPAPTTTTTMQPPGPLMHPWAPPVTAPPAAAPAVPAAPLGDTSKGGWRFTVPSPKNLLDNLEGVGRAVIPGAGQSTGPVPVPAPAPPIPIVVP